MATAGLAGMLWWGLGCTDPQAVSPSPVEPARGPDLQVTELVEGGSIDVRVGSAAPRARVRVYFGDRTGSGPCFGEAGDTCVSVEDAGVLGTGTTDEDGSWFVSVPLTAAQSAGTPLVFQAVVDLPVPTVSNVVSRVVEAAGTTAGPKGPNLLVVLFDDVGIDKLAAYGSPTPAHTPTLDRLAATGVTFDVAYSRPVCSPARIALQTGRHGRRTGLGINWKPEDPWQLGLEQLTLAELVALSPTFDYSSAYLGKWHLGAARAASGFDHPLRQGYDSYAGSFGNLDVDDAGGSYFDWEKVVDGREVRTRTYATTDTIDDAITQLGTLQEPWLLMVSLNAAHQPWEPPPRSLLPMRNDEGAGYITRQIVSAADTELGRMVEAIPEGMASRTTIFVTSDNGTHYSQVQPPYTAARSKATLFDGGLRVPLVVSGAAVGAPGTHSQALVDLVDLFPTIAELVGVDVRDLASATDPAVPLALDGVSLVPQLSDPTVPTPRTSLYSELFSPNGSGPYFEANRQSVRDEHYKLIVDHLLGKEMFFEYVPGASDEGPDLLPCGLSPAQQAGYERLVAELARIDSELVLDAAPLSEPLGPSPFPLEQDSGYVTCE